MTGREEFLKKLLATFRIEAAEGITNLTANLIELEKELPEERKTELVEASFREAHSLKGASRAVNETTIEKICQALESVFSGLKQKSVRYDSSLFDVFHQALNTLNDILGRAGSNQDGVDSAKVDQVLNGLSQIIQLNSGPAPEKSAAPVTVQAPAAEINPVQHRQQDTIRISSEKLTDLFFQAEELLELRQSFSYLKDSVKSLTAKMQLLKQESPGLQSSEWTVSLIKSMEDDLEKLRKSIVRQGYSSGLKIETLLDEVKKIMSVPFSTVLDGFSKAARDLSRDQGKEILVEIRGADIEIDRRILEEIGKPLNHILRNSIDHGIENPQVRAKMGKPAHGTIRVAVDRLENNRIEILISDDGAGVDIEKLRKKFIGQENLSPEQAVNISEATLLDFAFKSGISTGEMITDLSGRGLGLAIVREKIEQLGGVVTLSTLKNKGTEFRIRIPLSMATFRGVRIQLGERQFIMPTAKIERALRIEKSAVRTIESKPTIVYREEILPLVYLADVLGIPNKESEGDYFQILVMGPPDKLIGFCVDEILDEEVVQLKKFNAQLQRVKNISGATVLGSGKVVPVLNVSDLLLSALSNSGVSDRNRTNVSEHKQKSILVVEDSITSRMLLKNILETAGYSVATAIDGMEGYARLKENPADLVVSDVDMPRMNGIDMTSKIRSDKSVAAIPVVLVTSLSRREDRERGMEAGASAYIVKSNFDQGNLLEVIERLIG